MLNRWLLGFFHGDGLQKLKERLGEDRWEGLHEDGQTLFFHQLTGNLFNIDLIDESTLRRYDLSIARHWQTITAARNKREGHMGLLNMGQGEGSQIIQLFGRGVRLKGRGFSLKRTPKGELPKGLYLEKLETLNIFGVRADYMAKFKDYLREEGITPTDEILELDFPTRANLPAKSLKTLRLKDGYKDNQKNGFKRTHFPALYEVPAAFIDSESGRSKIKPPHVVVDLYPRIQALSSSEGRNAQKAKDARQTGKLSTGALRFFDWDRIFLTVQPDDTAIDVIKLPIGGEINCVRVKTDASVSITVSPRLGKSTDWATCGKFVDYGKFVHVGLVMPEMEYLSLLSRIDSASKREQPMSITISVVMPKARNSKSDGSDLKREPYLMVKDAIFECPARQGQKFGR